jgi:hypothetical protein
VLVKAAFAELSVEKPFFQRQRSASQLRQVFAVVNRPVRFLWKTVFST